MQGLFTILENNYRSFRKVYLRVEPKVRIVRHVRVSPSVVYSYCRNDLQHHIFRVEIPASFLGDFANACLQHLSKVDDITPVIELLSKLSTCNRFDLTVCFMMRDEKSICERLFQQLQLKGRSSDESFERAIKSLAAKYEVKLN